MNEEIMPTFAESVGVSGVDGGLIRITFGGRNLVTQAEFVITISDAKALAGRMLRVVAIREHLDNKPSS